jgi:hypothetical protein
MPRVPFNFNKINKDRLVKTFEVARGNYLQGNALDARDKLLLPGSLGPNIQTPHEFSTTSKNFYSLGMSYLFRRYKCNERIPNLNNMTDENALTMLDIFLHGEGNKDIASLKYNVVSLLSKNRIEKDSDAIELVDDFTRELGEYLVKRPVYQP